MSSSRDPASLRLGLNPLTTSITLFHSQQGTPISAVPMASSNTQVAQTPVSAIQPYNPQEWVTSRAPRQQTGAEPQVSPPPPPYSPPRSQQPRPVSSAFDQHQPSPVSTPPVPRLPHPHLYHSSPEPAANVSFPPPPGSGGRGPSRERRFGLPSLSRRRETEPQPTTPEPRPRVAPAARQSMGPTIFQSPGSIRPSLTLDMSHPPAARRAMSAGAVETPTSARSRSGSQTRWEWPAGVPPPPPGPPPPGSRSHSVQPVERTSVPLMSPPTRRPPPSSGSSLDPVPPTPANWVDESNQPPRSDSVQSRPLRIDTEMAQQSDQVPEPLQSSGSASGLNRAGAVRHDKTIIQRRAESRTRQGSHGSIDEGTNPHNISNIVVPSGSSNTPRPLTTPRSASGGGPQTGESSARAGSNTSTPNVRSGKLPMLNTSIAPFTPSRLGHNATGSQSVVPKALPTPPPHGQSASSANARESSRPPAGSRTPSTKDAMRTQSADQFAAGTVERFQAFAASESTAASDADRVRLFADFIVNESRIRRERYSSAIGAMGSEIFDLTRDLFRPMVAPRRESVTSQDSGKPDTAGPQRSRASSLQSNPPAESGPSSAPASGRLPPSPSAGAQGGANYNSNYMPSLSPILSMSVSDNYGDGSSRGRPSSRWWETDSQGDGSKRVERSKRESKYMGVPKTQWAEVEMNASTQGTLSEQGSTVEYPQEKTGWHDEESVCTPQPSRFPLSPGQAASTPSPAPGGRGFLDVSRLVTLPPPYPRHHPAVENNHPELSATRTAVRALSDLSEISKVKEKYKADSTKRREDFTKESTERHQALRANLHQEISSGNMGYADAAAIEADLKSHEDSKKKDLEKAEYEQFQNVVIMPLNDLLTGRISRATELYASLSEHLFDDGQMDADMPQEEGDDRPELLEKLTLLKWIFEARETLHRAIFDILSDRNGRYRDVIITPYRLAGNTEKLKSAEAFFAEDAANRELAYANEVLDRARDFRQVVDEAVHKGIALQLSAFWDIAPPLSRLLESIPTELDGFNIQIPASEYEENPAYRDHPMQYLLSLLLHTEKSTYQFIEAHTNLLCLLHEAKEAVANAKAKILATQIKEADGTPISPEQREERSRAMRQGEDRRLTEDLKEKVRVVQDQWNNALAQSIASVKERIAGWLLETGGWDDSLVEG
ncbi:unnamed protein product [Clonostachys rosea f. rosea IK726]|uniref:Uncharacterized protein n=1 Tax=Clonostachys rosea f. rosea IK726 TaxID=1349383 RepID=A0ACA9TSL3_BIOOC|nr:unnamed protein product [Clonostachys rosea f. rosea IK726]